MFKQTHLVFEIYIPKKKIIKKVTLKEMSSGLLKLDASVTQMFRCLFFFIHLFKMPLIIISGYPSSGKTQRVNEIKDYLVKKLEQENKSLRIHVINDESLHVTKDAYNGSLNYYSREKI